MNLPKTYRTYPKPSGLNQILPDLPKTYPTYLKFPRLTQNLPDLPETYQTYVKITKLVQNLPELSKTYFIVTYALTYCYNLILNKATFSYTCFVLNF